MSHPVLDRYAPEPTRGQLAALGEGLREVVSHDYRILGGLGGTMDVLRLSDGRRVLLKRYWLSDDDNDVNPAQGEFRALQLAAAHGIPAPEPLWLDTIGLFPERGMVMSFLDGRPLLDPDDELSWAAQLAAVLVSIHGITPDPDDKALFPVLDEHDGHHTEKELLELLGQHPLGMRLWETRQLAMGDLVPEPAVYCHHDFWPGNTLWVGERLVAVVDWEGGSIGDPALDVAYCEMDLRLIGRDAAADRFVETYRALSGRPVVNLDFWRVNALCRPMPDVAIWLPSWLHMGLDMTAELARERHDNLIRAALVTR